MRHGGLPFQSDKTAAGALRHGAVRLMFASGLTLAALKPAAAQLVNNNEQPEATVPDRMSVLQRSRPDYDALGERIGSFLAFPAIDLQEEYNSNVYAAASNDIGDFETTVSPAVRLASDWENHALTLNAGSDIHRFQSRVSENNSDYKVGADGRLDLFSDSYLALLYTDALSHEPRSSPDSVGNQKSPTAFQQETVHTTFSHETYRIGLRIEGDVERFLYQDGVTDGGVGIPEKYRDRYDYLLTPRLSYEIVPGYHAFIKAPLNEHLYDTSSSRNSQGGEIDAGTGVDLGNVITAELFVGTLRQYYNNPAFHTLSGVNYGGNCLWNFSALSSFKLALTHNVQETTLVGASSDLQTSVLATVEHELRPNLLVSAGGGYLRDAFEGTSRLDSNFTGNAGVRYLLNSSLYLEVKGLYQTRQSSADAFDFRQDTISVTIHAQR